LTSVVVAGLSDAARGGWERRRGGEVEGGGQRGRSVKYGEELGEGKDLRPKEGEVVEAREARRKLRCACA
jgi:hypothetical protein